MVLKTISPGCGEISSLMLFLAQLSTEHSCSKEECFCFTTTRFAQYVVMYFYASFLGELKLSFLYGASLFYGSRLNEYISVSLFFCIIIDVIVIFQQQNLYRSNVQYQKHFDVSFDLPFFYQC